MIIPNTVYGKIKNVPNHQREMELTHMPIPKSQNADSIFFGDLNFPAHFLKEVARKLVEIMFTV